jgi:hypothetical protein
MRNRATTLVGAALLVCLIPAMGHAALTVYSQDFEALIQPDPGALAADGWVVYGNVYEPDGVTYLYGYGVFPAPNDGFGFCQIALLEGGTEQGAQQLAVFSDYNNVDHGNGKIIESNTYQEQSIALENVGQTWRFTFDAKLGNLEGSSTALAFIKTLDPGAGFATTNFISQDMTSIPDTWSTYTLSIAIDPSLEGQLLQIGFSNRATAFLGSGVFYDNVDLRRVVVATPPGEVAIGASLRQNYPNPFNPQTRIEFTTDRPGNVKITVFDLAGRRVATLRDGEIGAGQHSVTWNGRAENGVPVASGRYSYVLETASGRIARSMTLLK